MTSSRFRMTGLSRSAATAARRPCMSSRRTASSTRSADVGATEVAGAVAGDGIIELPTATVAAQLFAAAVSPDGKRIAATTNADDNGARLVVLDVN